MKIQAVGPWMALLILGGCYGHARIQAPAPAPEARPVLPSASAGRYLIYSGDHPIGEERFEVRSGRDSWTVTGTVVLRFPTTSTHGYTLTVDPRDREPLRIDVWYVLEGIRISATGRRRFDTFDFTIRGLFETTKKSIGYGPGTSIYFPSPLSSAHVLSLLGPSLSRRASIPVRTIVIAPPSLVPGVELLDYKMLRDDGGQREISVRRGGRSFMTLLVPSSGVPARALQRASRGVVRHDLKAQTSTVAI